MTSHQFKKNKLIVEIPFRKEDWWLVCENGKPGMVDQSFGIWWLARKIDRSYKGKDPDIAVLTLQVESEELFKDLVEMGVGIVWSKGEKGL